MSDETSRPTCPFKNAGAYMPPRFQQSADNSVTVGPARIPGG
jgi:hypothetical protein